MRAVDKFFICDLKSYSHRLHLIWLKKVFKLKSLVILFIFLSFGRSGFAQLNYIVANTQNISGSYTDLGATGSSITTNFTGGAMTFDDDNSAVQNIGFTF